MRVVVLITQSWVKPSVSFVVSELRAVKMAFSSVHTHMILRVCVTDGLPLESYRREAAGIVHCMGRITC
jgi:hypothetical protein